ncbi:MAG: MmgE/PrpD family protein [Chromatiales bacterium]|nr:MmgE/PrpD family protein [Chromatiales bacterium]
MSPSTETETDATEALARFVSGLQFEAIPDHQLPYVAKSLLDWVGCCLAGSHEPAVSALEAVLEPMGGAPHATVIARGRKTSVLNAVLLNGAAGNLLDLDDVHAGLIGHPSAVLAPTVLSLAEWLGKDGHAVHTAYVAGYEVMVRLGIGVEPELYQRGWHATGVLGAFGACAAAARLLDLTPPELVSAFAIAGTQAAGLRALFGTPARSIHQGKAAMAGILACLWSREGVTAGTDVVGARHGLRVLSGKVDTDAILDGLGQHFLLAQTGYKRHAASGSLHAAIDAALALRSDYRITPADVVAVRIATHPLALDLAVPHARPASAFSAKQSFHFSVAIALQEGRCDLDLYADAMIADPEIRRLGACVQIEADTSMQYTEAMPAEVTITLRNGSCRKRRIDTPKGRPSNPMTSADLAAKFRQLAAGSLQPAHCEEVITNLASADSFAIGALMTKLAAARRS